MPNCKENQIINPATGRCVLKTGAIGKSILGLKSPPKPKKEKLPPKPKKEKSPNVKSPREENPFTIPSGHVDKHTKRVTEIMNYILKHPVDKTQAYIKRKQFIEKLQIKYKNSFKIETLKNLNYYDAVNEYNKNKIAYDSLAYVNYIINIMEETRDFYDDLLFEGNLKKSLNVTEFDYMDKSYLGIMSFLYYHNESFRDLNPNQKFYLGNMDLINNTYLRVNDSVKDISIRFKNKKILNDALEIFGSFVSIVVLIMEHEIAHQLDAQIATVNNEKIQKGSKQNGGGHTKKFWDIYSAYTGHDVHLNFGIFYSLGIIKKKILERLKNSEGFIEQKYIEEFVNLYIEKIAVAEKS